MKSTMSLVFALLLAVQFGSIAHAGGATDKMADCLVKQTTGQDRIHLVRWIVLGYSQHPDVSPLLTVKSGQINATNKKIATLIEVLLLERCHAETKKALSKDGQVAMQNAFEVLGKVAARELLNDRKVNATIMEFQDYLDMQALAKIQE